MNSHQLKSAPDLGPLDVLTLFKDWCLRNRLAALLVFTILATCVLFFGWMKIFVNGIQSVADWAADAWVGDQSHSWMVPPISLYLAWHHREAIWEARKEGSNRGLIYLILGVALFVIAARCLQPRISLAAVPLLLYGSVLYLFGKQVARILLFPCAFLLFMIPMAAVEQATFRLQFFVTGSVDILSHLIGIDIQAVGTTLTARDGSFNFEIAEGCSGIRSITAMTMLTAVYVHLTQKVLWKKATIFCCSVLFAIIGNAGRIFTIILMAKFYDSEIAAGVYHDYSAFIFFPFALAAMLGLAKLLSLPQGLPKRVNSALKEKTDTVKYDY